MKFVPSFMASWNDIKWTMMGNEYVLRPFLVDLALPVGQLVTCFVAWVLCNVITNYRLFYLLFSLPATIVAFVLVLLFVALLITPIHQYIPQKDRILPIAEKAYFYGCIGYAAFMLLFSFIALFYNHTYPLKYGRLYHLRKARIRLSKSWSERGRVRREFYSFYKKRKYKELIGLLVEPYLPVDSTLELIPEAIYYMKLNAGDANSEIKAVEIDQALESGGALAARLVYQRALEELALARQGDLSFLKRGGKTIVMQNNGQVDQEAAAPVVIVKQVPVYVRPKKKKPDTRPIDYPLWSPDEIC